MHNLKEDLQDKVEMLGGRWGEKWRNRQGLIWGAQSPLAAQFNGARRASEAVTLLELSDLNKEVFCLARQGRVSFGVWWSKEPVKEWRSLETPLGPSSPSVLPQLCQAHWKIVLSHEVSDSLEHLLGVSGTAKRRCGLNISSAPAAALVQHSGRGRKQPGTPGESVCSQGLSLDCWFRWVGMVF